MRDYLRAAWRGATGKQTQPVMRFESAPGEQCQIDWGHFGSMAHGDTAQQTLLPGRD